MPIFVASRASQVLVFRLMCVLAKCCVLSAVCSVLCVSRVRARERLCVYDCVRVHMCS